MSALAALAVWALTAAPASAAGCPATAGGLVVNQPPRAALVRPGARRLLLCRYGPLRRRRLRQRRLVTSRREVTRAARRLNALPAPSPGATACPSDDGRLVLAVFRHPDGSRDRVRVETTGCGYVSGGGVIRWTLFPGGGKVVGYLKRLLDA